jgi:catechol 2,3-dioxygenase
MGTTATSTQGERRQVLPDALSLGAAHLKVAELDRAIAWYSEVLGFQLHGRDGDVARLGAGGDDLIVLHERPGARTVSRHSGLYHVAILYPSRLELARVTQRIAEAQTPIQGASDHGTHEAIYLPDPDGNGLELAADRPADQWPNLADITAIAPQPLDMGGLFNLVSGRDAVPEADIETRVGHLHLHVGDIAEAKHFYRDLVGFDLITEMDSAAFVSAGGYHHHLAFNIWQGKGAPPAPEDAAGLLFWTVELPSAEDVDAARQRIEDGGFATGAVEGGFETRDPSGNAVRIVVS